MGLPAKVRDMSAGHEIAWVSQCNACESTPTLSKEEACVWAYNERSVSSLTILSAEWST